MAEWSIAADSKSVVPIGYRGFESLSLRQFLHREERHARPELAPTLRAAIKLFLQSASYVESMKFVRGSATYVVHEPFAFLHPHAMHILHPFIPGAVLRSYARDRVADG